MSENTTKPRSRNQPQPEQPSSPIAAAPRQLSTSDAWKQFADRLVGALYALEEDEYLVLTVKGTKRYVQFMDQGSYGMRIESVSDYYLPEDEHLSQPEYDELMRLGWEAPTQLPELSNQSCDGSPNYFLDLARPMPLEDVAMLAVFTLIRVHYAGHPGQLEYEARSVAGESIRLPHLLIRRCAPESRA